MKLEYSQTVENVKMTGRLETDAVQNELQTLRAELAKDKMSRVHDQQFLQNYVEQVKTEQAQSSH